MRERIMRLSRGIVDAEMPKLFLDPVKIEETLGSDTVYKRELYLASENNLYIKGLAYSSHSRVKILKNAFGGLRNHIVYEVDTSWCENGDLIKGNFTLVTNSGELEVPFLFRVEMIESVRVLSTLKSMDDFVELAKKDMELALRLMEYRDFTEAPLFKDLRIRTIYEGLRGHGNRQNALEEFFLATGVKEPIELTLSTAKKVYDKPKDIVNDKVVLRKNTWGYLYMEVRADGDFIEIPKKVITQADFEEDRLDLRFRIHPERMHKGKNLGAIRLLTVHGDTVIRIEAMGEEPDRKRAEGEISKAGVCRYMKLREAYESGLYEKKAVLGKIQNELDAIKASVEYDALEMSGSRAVWPEVLSVYAVKTTSDPDNPQEVATITPEKEQLLKDLFWEMNEITHRTETKTETVIVETDDGNGNILEEEVQEAITTLYITVSHRTADEMAVQYSFNEDQKQQLAELLAQDSSMWAAVLYGIYGVDDQIVAVALSQVGNVGGEPYWSWYGFGSRVEWCACFVSWCANECGYIDTGVIPKFAGCVNGVQWFRERGQWADNAMQPSPGMIIFFDWDNKGSSGPQDGQADHVGIVQKVENGVVYTIEGNSGDSCRVNQYPVGHYEILGYGVVAY